jgi:hypothetical protein
MPVTISGSGAATFPSVTSNSQIFNGSSSGTTTVQAAATASGTITVPAGTGTIAVNGVSSNLVTGTPASVSSTSTIVSGIPSWARRVIVSGVGIVKSGTSLNLVQLGVSGGITTSGYSGIVWYIGTGNLSTSTSGFPVFPSTLQVATSNLSFVLTLTLNNSSTNQWVGTISTYDSVQSYGGVGNGNISLSGALTQIRIIGNGTDTYSAGTLNVSWE